MKISPARKQVGSLLTPVLIILCLPNLLALSGSVVGNDGASITAGEALAQIVVLLAMIIGLARMLRPKQRPAQKGS